MNREGPDRNRATVSPARIAKGLWWERSWNPAVGCTHGCPWCWARPQAKRQKHNCPKCYAFTPHLHPERLGDPLHWSKPVIVAVCLMGDFFDQELLDSDRSLVLGTMRLAKKQRFVILTKQPQRAKRFSFPPNVVLGVSVEDQESADRLIPELMECKASTRIVSIEPMRGAVDLASLRTGPDQPMEGFADTTWHPCGNALRKWKPPADWRPGIDIGPSWTGLDGVILGGQTGAGAVPMHPDWVRAVRDQCAGAGVPFFFKQWGEWVPTERGRARAVQNDAAYVSHDGGRAYGMPKDYEGYCHEFMRRVGRKRAGRMLDGRTHDEVAWTPVRSAECGVRSEGN